jgi:ATP-dependent helicase Lhr and Lhr-like helicase
MLEYKNKPDSADSVRRILNPIVEKWFFSKFKEFSLPQRTAVLDIHSRKNILVSAPTGATKTLTAFLAILNELVDSAAKGILQDKIYAVYVSPLLFLAKHLRKSKNIRHTIKVDAFT